MTTEAEWECLPGEPAKWFHRFERYLLAGPGRSVEGVWKVEAKQGGNSKQKQVPSGHWHRISQRWNWKSRAEAWDAAQSEISAKQIERERSEESRARRNLLRAYRVQVEKALRKTRPGPNWQDLTSALRILCEQSRLEFGAEEAMTTTPTSRGQIIIMPEMEFPMRQ